jgi:subfamily B ATP-binding cassette protein MsbA
VAGAADPAVDLRRTRHLTFSTAYLNNWVMSRVLNDLRGMVFDRLLRLPVARFHEESTGKIINTVIGDVRQVVDMINSVFLAFVRDTLVVAGLLIACCCG